MSETEALLDSRLLLVTGKGGAGKTTYAAALAMLSAARGRRTLLCEVDAQRPSLTGLFGITPSYAPQPIADHLDIANLTFAEAMRAFLVDLIPSRRVVRLILENHAVQRFLDFTPGSREIVTLSTIGALVEQYDQVVVDLPASGHAFALMDITRSALGLFRTGPVRRRAAQLRRLLLAPDTRVALVALPEEMVVNETLETWARLREHELLGNQPVVFLNRATLPSLTDDERLLIGRLAAQDLSPTQHEFVRAGRWEDALEQGTATARDRLAAIAPPVLVSPARAGSDAREVVLSVAAALGREVGVARRDLAGFLRSEPVAAAARDSSSHRAFGPGWLDDQRLVVCVGAGGVGKTTTAAAIALYGATQGRRAIVLTIDPARRLANSLGLGALGNTEQRIELDDGSGQGELWAMMLDSRSTFDDLVARVASDDDARKRILGNHVYRHMADTYAGSQDYMATEKLHDLVTSGRWDLIVLDTPPVKNALDFLESPGRLVHFLDERVLRWFLHPYDARAIGGRFMLGTSAVVYKLLGYVFGADFLADLSQFFQDFQGLYAGFRARHEQVLELLRSPGTAFVSICGPTETTLDIALFFEEELGARELPRAGVVVNQVHDCDEDDHDAVAALGEVAREVGSDLAEPVIHSVLARLGMAHRRLRELAVAERQRTLRLRGALHADACYVEVPRFEEDVHDLPALRRVGAEVFRSG